VTTLYVKLAKQNGVLKTRLETNCTHVYMFSNMTVETRSEVYEVYSSATLSS